MSQPLIQVEHVSKKFCRSLKRSLRYAVADLTRELLGQAHGGNGGLRDDEFWALQDISFELRRGECIGLIGHNGAGKTTLLRMLHGLIKPETGKITTRGRTVAFIALGAGFNPILSGRENIYVNAAINGLTKKETDLVINDIIDFSEIREFIDGPVQNYSSGMVVRLGFSIAIHSRPEILMLDEVLAVGDIAFQIKCYNSLSKLRGEGVAFVLVSHNMHQISRFSNRTIYLNHGKILHYGDNETGIAKYLSDADASTSRLNQDTADETSQDRLHGSGNVELTNAYFIDLSGAKITRIDAGSGVIFAVEFIRHSPVIDNAVLDVIVRDSEGTVYQGTNLSSGQTFGKLPPAGRFEVQFGNIPCNVHRLGFSCALISANTVEVHDCIFDVELELTPHPTNHGKLVLPVSWRLGASETEFESDQNK